MHLASLRFTFTSTTSTIWSTKCFTTYVFTIVDNAIRNIKQTSMLCLNHITNRAYNADKSVIFVKIKVIIIIMNRCYLVLNNYIRNCLKCFCKIIDCCYTTVRFTFLLVVFVWHSWGFPFPFFGIGIIWLIFLLTSFNSWIVVLNICIVIRLISLICLCIVFLNITILWNYIIDIRI